ncbi:MAG: dienelactone hydrolase family protein [Rhodospirillaceae bacterium]
MAQAIEDRIERNVEITAGNAALAATLSVPADAAGIVLFAHGSGSSRNSPRNKYVARELNNAGYATLLFDLLTGEEEAEDRYTGKHRFDVHLLAGRMVHATHWLQSEPDLDALPVGYFGASTGSAGALIAASTLGERVKAVVSRGGRPDLAPPQSLGKVSAPTLLIVGENDDLVIQLNRVALALLRSEKDLSVVPCASHLFEEPGALEEVARLASDWFRRHLSG